MPIGGAKILQYVQIEDLQGQTTTQKQKGSAFFCSICVQNIIEWVECVFLYIHFFYLSPFDSFVVVLLEKLFPSLFCFLEYSFFG